MILSYHVCGDFYCYAICGVRVIFSFKTWSFICDEEKEYFETCLNIRTLE